MRHAAQCQYWLHGWDGNCFEVWKPSTNVREMKADSGNSETIPDQQSIQDRRQALSFPEDCKSSLEAGRPLREAWGEGFAASRGQLPQLCRSLSAWRRCRHRKRPTLDRRSRCSCTSPVSSSCCSNASQRSPKPSTRSPLSGNDDYRFWCEGKSTPCRTSYG